MIKKQFKVLTAKVIEKMSELRLYNDMEVVYMINRPLYTEKIMAYTDTPFVKVLTGVRRCGKSTILKMIMEKLQNESDTSCMPPYLLQQHGKNICGWIIGVFSVVGWGVWLIACKRRTADVMVYCQNLIDKLGLDPDEIVNMKMSMNEKKYPVEKAKGKADKYNQL